MDAVSVAIGLAARLQETAARDAEAWTCGFTPAPWPGYIDHAAVIAVVSGRPRVVADVIVLQGMGLAVEVVGAGKSCRTFRTADPLDKIADAIAEGLRARPRGTNVLDASALVRAALETQAPWPGSAWTISTTSSDAWGTAASVDIGTPDHDHFAVVTLRPVDGGLLVQAGAFERVVATAEDIDALLPALIAASLGELDRRARFRNRPFRAGQAAEAVCKALAAVKAPGPWRWKAVDQGWPSPPPWGVVFWEDEAHLVASADEDQGLVRVSVGGDRICEAATFHDFHPHLPAIVEAVRKRLGVLTTDRLQTGVPYRVLREFASFKPGDVVKITEIRYIPYDSMTFYDFESTRDARSERVWDADAMFGEIHLYLEPKKG